MHLHREKFITKGGPDGGDGGRGGHIIVRADKGLWTLFHLKHRKHFKAEHGGHGSKSRSTGKDGDDVYIDVPLGTIVRNAETAEPAKEKKQAVGLDSAAEGPQIHAAERSDVVSGQDDVDDLLSSLGF